MMQAESARLEWNSAKKRWQVAIHVGAEVIRRACDKTPRDAGEAALRDLAVGMARDEGYALDPARVSVAAPVVL